MKGTVCTKRFIRNCLMGVLALLLCLSGVMVPPSTVVASSTSPGETVRVGFFAFEGYHMMDEDGNRSGYGYDFLRMAARYLNLNFEYVGYDRSWDDMQEMLANGEIDLLTSVQKTSEREKIFDFSKPIGTSSGMLTVRSDNVSVIEQDYDTYQGLKVGLLRENSRNEDFKEFAQEKGFTYQAIYFDMESEIKEALQNGIIDATMTSSLRSIHDERIVEKFATKDFYVVVKKGNTALLNQINYAIDQMNLAEGDWKDELNYQYYGQTESKTLVFSEREQAIIDQYASGQKTLTVSCNADNDPYSYLEDGKLKGIIPDLFKQLMDYAGIPYQIVVPKDRKEYEELWNNGSVDIFMDARMTENETENIDAAITAPYLDMGLAMVTRRDFSGTVKKLAVANYQWLSGIEKNLLPDAERVYYETRTQAIEAVREGNADATFVYLYTAQKYVNLDDRGTLTYTVLDEPIYPHRICIMPTADKELAGILTKCIYAFSKGKIESLVLEYTTYKMKNVTVFTLIMLHPIKFIVILICLILVLMALLFTLTKLRARQKMLVIEKKRSEEKEVLAKLAKTANESKSRFLFNMSHDIRTPLNAVLGFTNLAKESIGNDNKERDYLDKIQISGEHLLEIVNDVLEMSRVETGTIKLEEKECCIKDVVEEVVVMISTESEKKRQNFVVDTTRMTYPYVWCDSLRVKEILANLLENAVKFTPAGGMVELTIAQQLDKNGTYADLEIQVKDTGCGMTPAFLEKMFEPFEREKSATVSGLNGTGLGLAITKRYVDAMGGQIHARSTENVGTEFIVNLRQKLAEVSKKEEPVKETNEVSFYGKRILIAEDNDLNREIEVAILEDAGFLVDEAVDGKQAVDKVSASKDGYYSGILMDIQMPVMDGYEATREIRKLKDQALAKTPIIAVSANAFDEDKVASKEAGMDAHIEKPIQLEYLFETLKKVLGDNV